MSHYTSPILSRFQWTLDIDLVEDFKTIIYNDLIRAGYKGVKKDAAIFQYYNLMKRRVPKRPRKVLHSKEFICPEEYKIALSEFEEKVKVGADLTPFLTEKLQEADYHDLLLNDWNIHHFHLSRRFRDDGLVARSNYLIFARVTADIVYMIQIYDHNAEDVFSQKEMIRILRDNWPETIDRYHIHGARELSEHYNDHEYGMIREGGMQTFVELGENEVYGLMGGGYASNGASLEVVQQSDYWIGRLNTLQRIVVNEACQIGQAINQATPETRWFRSMHIHYLWFDDKDTVTMCETNSGMIVRHEGKKRRFYIGRGRWFELKKSVSM